MAKLRTLFRCHECGTGAPKWAGRCPGCGSWNTLVEEVEVAPATVAPGLGDRAVPMKDVDTREWAARPTGLAELNRVLGGGLVPGSLTLLGGEPGIGKSTLLLQIAVHLPGKRVLYISGEESEQQIKMRAERVGKLQSECYILTETTTQQIFQQ